MNTDVMFSSKTDEWETPQALFDELNREFGFTLDVCALPENAKCDLFFTQKRTGFLNPERPYVLDESTIWQRKLANGLKAYEESQRGATVVCLLPAGQIQGGFTITYTARPK